MKLDKLQTLTIVMLFPLRRIRSSRVIRRPSAVLSLLYNKHIRCNMYTNKGNSI